MWKTTTASMQSSKYIHTTDVENSYGEFSRSKVQLHCKCGKWLECVCKVQSTSTPLMWKTVTVSMQSPKYVHTADVENSDSEYAKSKVHPHCWCGKLTVSMQSPKYVHTADVENWQWVCKVQSTSTLLMWKTTVLKHFKFWAFFLFFYWREEFTVTEKNVSNIFTVCLPVSLCVSLSSYLSLSVSFFIFGCLCLLFACFCLFSLIVSLCPSLCQSFSGVGWET